jgi:hypothetical protein
MRGRIRGGEGAWGRLGWLESGAQGQVLQRNTQEPAQEGLSGPGQGFRSLFMAAVGIYSGCLFLLEN